MIDTTGTMVDFSRRWAELSGARSPLCLGVAPSPVWLRRWSLSDDLAGARAYCELLLSAADTRVGAYKVQVPFFLRHGSAGMTQLRWFVDEAHCRGSLVLLDAKLGDADDTMDSYADLYLGPRSQLGGDAVTATAYMGMPSLEPLLRAAGRLRAAVFVLVRTSNHAAGDVQTCRTVDGRTTAQAVADAVTSWNRTHYPDATTGPAAAVIGARLPESAELVSRLPESLLEIPGLGRADRRTDEVLAPVRNAPRRALLTVTTGVLSAGPDTAGIRRAIEHWRAEIAQHLPTT